MPAQGDHQLQVGILGHFENGVEVVPVVGALGRFVPTQLGPHPADAHPHVGGGSLGKQLAAIEHLEFAEQRHVVQVTVVAQALPPGRPCPAVAGRHRGRE